MAAAAAAAAAAETSAAAGGDWLETFERERLGEGALKDVAGPLTPEVVLRELKR